MVFLLAGDGADGVRQRRAALDRSIPGIDVSEEMSRYFFVWLTFIGAVVVMREHLHLGVDMLVGKFGRTGRSPA